MSSLINESHAKSIRVTKAPLEVVRPICSRRSSITARPQRHRWQDLFARTFPRGPSCSPRILRSLWPCLLDQRHEAWLTPEFPLPALAQAAFQEDHAVLGDQHGLGSRVTPAVSNDVAEHGGPKRRERGTWKIGKWGLFLGQKILNKMCHV